MHFPFSFWQSDLYLRGDEVAAWQPSSETPGWKCLDLRFAEVDEFPFEDSCFAYLHELVIVGVKFSKFPSEIFGLQQLGILRLVNVEFSQFPVQTCEMELRKLSMRGAGFTAIPDALSQLRHLRELDLGGNELRSFDVDLRACRRLKWFQISDNPLQKLPSLLPPNTCLGLAGTPFREFTGWRFKDLPQDK